MGTALLYLVLIGGTGKGRCLVREFDVFYSDIPGLFA